MREVNASHFAFRPRETSGPCSVCGFRTSVERVTVTDAAGPRTERWTRCLRYTHKAKKYAGVTVYPCPVIKEIIIEEIENVIISKESKEKYNSLWAKDRALQVSKLACLPVNTVKGFIYGNSAGAPTAERVESAILKLWAKQNEGAITTESNPEEPTPKCDQAIRDAEQAPLTEEDITEIAASWEPVVESVCNHVTNYETEEQQAARLLSEVLDQAEKTRSFWSIGEEAETLAAQLVHLIEQCTEKQQEIIKAYLADRFYQLKWL